jgi:hypothetical protein
MINRFAINLAVLSLSALSLCALSFGQSDKEMRRMMEAGAPGKEHARLASLAGTWKSTVTYVMGGKSNVGHADMKADMIMGGRFLRMDYLSTVNGQPLEVLEYFGFDNTTKRYREVLFDNSSTDVRTAESRSPRSDGPIVTYVNYLEPGTRKPVKLRIETTIVGKDKFTVNWYQSVGGKPEEKVVGIVNVRG